LDTQAVAAGTPSAALAADIGSSLAAAHTAQEAHTALALVPAARVRLGGPGPLPLPERSARHPQLAR